MFTGNKDVIEYQSMLSMPLRDLFVVSDSP